MNPLVPKPGLGAFLFSGGGAMVPLFRVGLALLLLKEVPGWWPLWSNSTSSLDDVRPDFQEDPKKFAAWAWNSTWEAVGNFQLPDVTSRMPDSWDGWIWTMLDMFISALGWAIFGSSWTKVRSGFAMILRVSLILVLCLVAHYVLALCWPMVSLLIAGVMTAVWMVRAATRMFGRLIFYSQKLSGGVPEAVGADFFGPGVGEVPDTASLRKLKKGADGDRWVLVKRDGHTVIFKVADASSIKTNGLYLSIEPDTLRGSQALLKHLQGWDKVHLCRQELCQEEGQHFKQYAVVKPFDAERFQVTAAATEAHKTGSKLVGWFKTGATKAVQRAREYASESETEANPCLAHRIVWEDHQGRRMLSSSPCKCDGSETVDLLVEDCFTDFPTTALCPKHCSEYVRHRFQLKCVVEGCARFGEVGKEGYRLCSQHVFTEPPATSRSRSTTSRSRSRSRARGDEDERRDRGYETEEENGTGLRRRVRLRDDDGQEDGDVPKRRGLHPENLLDEIREERETKVLRKQTSSPGNTPRSSVQKNLAKMGLIHSPDRRQVQTTLEEFMEQLVDGRELNLNEEDVRRQMAGQYGMTMEALTAMLFEQATEEQRKGTKGLSKFLAKWRKQAAVAARDDSDRSRADSWSVIEGVSSSPSSSVQVTPPKPATSSQSMVILPPPGIYGEDRKAGTGGLEPMTEIAKAIQQQTSELASLVKSQNDNSNIPSGTIKSLGRVSSLGGVGLLDAGMRAVHSSGGRWRIWVLIGKCTLGSAGGGINEIEECWFPAEGHTQIGSGNLRSVLGNPREVCPFSQ